MEGEHTLSNPVDDPSDVCVLRMPEEVLQTFANQQEDLSTLSIEFTDKRTGQLTVGGTRFRVKMGQTGGIQQCVRADDKESDDTSATLVPVGDVQMSCTVEPSARHGCSTARQRFVQAEQVRRESVTLAMPAGSPSQIRPSRPSTSAATTGRRRSSDFNQKSKAAPVNKDVARKRRRVSSESAPNLPTLPTSSSSPQASRSDGSSDRVPLGRQTRRASVLLPEPSKVANAEAAKPTLKTAIAEAAKPTRKAASAEAAQSKLKEVVTETEVLTDGSTSSSDDDTMPVVHSKPLAKRRSRSARGGGAASTAQKPKTKAPAPVPSQPTAETVTADVVTASEPLKDAKLREAELESFWEMKAALEAIANEFKVHHLW